MGSETSQSYRYIVRSPDVRGGHARVEGTRIAVHDVIGLLQNGETVESVVASVQVLRNDPVVMQVQSVVNNEIRSAEDLNTQVKVLESFAIIQRVADRLSGEDLKAFLAPYQREAGAPPPNAAEIIFKNRKIVPVRLSLVLQVQYLHPDKHVAAKVASTGNRPAA